MESIKLDRYLECLSENYLLILTSNSKEKEAVDRQLSYKRGLTLSIENLGASIGVISNAFVIHITGTSGVSDRLSVPTLTNSFLANTNFPKPKLILLVGFCWGNTEKVKVGDTIISNTIISMNRQTANPEGIEYNNKTHTSKLKLDIECIIQLAISNRFNVHVGQLASLEMLIKSSYHRNGILKEVPGVLGGEMEAFALVPSLNFIPWLIIKTVSDSASDSFDRDSQSIAAYRTSSIISLLLPEIISQNNFNFVLLNQLVDDLKGNTIRFDKSQFNSDTLNDYLNNKIGPIIIGKLGQYTSGAEYDKSFPYLLCDLLLEIVQNSFKHGGAKEVIIEFNPKSISVKEDVEAFDMTLIQGNRGGHQSWIKVDQKYLGTGQLSYSVKGKSQRIDLLKIDKNFRNIIENCSAEIIPSTVKSGFPSEVLSVKDSCNEVYIDVKNIFMTSRRLDMVSDIRKMLIKGKIVYISCRDQSEVENYRCHFAEHLGQLIIFAD